MGIPAHLTCLLRNLYAGQEATVRTGSPLPRLVHLCLPSSSPSSWSLPISHSSLLHRIYCPGLKPQSLGTRRSTGQGHHPLRFHDLQPRRGLDQWQGPGLKGQHTDQGKAQRYYFRTVQSPGHPEWGLGSSNRPYFIKQAAGHIHNDKLVTAQLQLKWEAGSGQQAPKTRAGQPSKPP